MTLSGEQRERPKRTPPGATGLVGRSWRKPGGETGLEHRDRGKQPWITAAPGPEAERYDRGHPVVRLWTAGDAFPRDAAAGASAELGSLSYIQLMASKENWTPWHLPAQTPDYHQRNKPDPRKCL